MEIERKFLLSTLPNLPLLGISFIEQGYLSIDPEVRIRSKRSGSHVHDYTLCIKSNGSLEREEIETELSHEQFDKLRALCGKPLIRKIYMTYTLAPHILQCSIVDPGEGHSFIYAEIEFTSAEEATNFQPPDFLWRDVTDDPRLKMKNIWKEIKAIT